MTTVTASTAKSTNPPAPAKEVSLTEWILKYSALREDGSPKTGTYDNKSPYSLELTPRNNMEAALVSSSAKITQGQFKALEDAINKIYDQPNGGVIYTIDTVTGDIYLNVANKDKRDVLAKALQAKVSAATVATDPNTEYHSVKIPGEKLVDFIDANIQKVEGISQKITIQNTAIEVSDFTQEAKKILLSKAEVKDATDKLLDQQKIIEDSADKAQKKGSAKRTKKDQDQIATAEALKKYLDPKTKDKDKTALEKTETGRKYLALETAKETAQKALEAAQKTAPATAADAAKGTATPDAGTDANDTGAAKAEAAAPSDAPNAKPNKTNEPTSTNKGENGTTPKPKTKAQTLIDVLKNNYEIQQFGTCFAGSNGETLLPLHNIPSNKAELLKEKFKGTEYFKESGSIGENPIFNLNLGIGRKNEQEIINILLTPPVANQPDYKNGLDTTANAQQAELNKNNPPTPGP